MNDIANYRFCSGLKDAWEKVHGVKKAIWGSVALFVLISAGGISILSWTLMINGRLFLPHFVEIVRGHYEVLLVNVTLKGSLIYIGVALAYYLAVICFEMFMLLPMRFGALLISLRRSVDKCVSPLFVFKFFHWHYIKKFIWLEVLLAIMVGIPGLLSIFAFCIHYLYPTSLAIKITGITLSVLFGALTIYLAVGYLFSGQIIIDRDTSAWQALEISRKAVTKRWFSVFFTSIWLFVTMFIGTIPLMIGLIWAIPYTFNVVAVLYRDMIGVAGKDPVTSKELMCARAKA